MWLTKITHSDGAINCGNNFGESNVFRCFCKDVSATNAALGLHESRTFQHEENLLEVRLGEPRALGDVTHRGGPARVGVEGERQERPARIITPGGHSHGPIVGAGLWA